MSSETQVYNLVRGSETGAGWSVYGDATLQTGDVISVTTSDNDLDATNAILTAPFSVTSGKSYTPAEGETISGVGALTSDNLLEGLTPNLSHGASATDDGFQLAAYGGPDHHQDQAVWDLVGQSAVESNQTMTASFALRGDAAMDGALNVAIGYKDSAGNINWHGSSVEVATGWGHAFATLVIPAGMTPYRLYLSPTNGSPSMQVANVSLRFGGRQTLASTCHTPYVTQEHADAVFATQASLTVQADRITSEVAARKQTDTNLSALSTKVTQTETSITTEISDRKQAVSAAQTAAVNSANSATDAKLGSYTKTADLADTAAVKDAKKAGTDAQAKADQAATAASKATETANTANTTAGQAKTAAADAQETANTAKTNAAAAQSTANTAKANAATAKTTADSAAATANTTATMIRQYAGGVLVAKTGAAVGALVNANGSFDVVALTWSRGVPSVSGTLSSFDANSADIGTAATPGAYVNLMGGAARFYVKQWVESDDGSREVRINASGNGSVIVIGPEDEATNGGLIIRSDSGIPKLITDDDPYPTDAAIATQWPLLVQDGMSIGGKAVKWKSAAVTLNTSSSLLGAHSSSCLINPGLGLAYLAIDMTFESPGWQPGTGTWLFRLPSGLRPSATKRLYNLIQIYIGGRWGAHVDVHSDGYCYPTWGWQATNIMCNLVFPTALLGGA